LYDYLSNKPKNFVDDLEKLYRLRRREAQAKKLEFADLKAEAEGLSESAKESPPPSPRENYFHRYRWENNHSRSARSGSYAPRTRRPTNLEPRVDQKAVRDQDLNNSHGAIFTLHR
jgi:hypothetical protein